ncbi:hypothetical protein HPB47_005418 [Ixodes persulcatus]|uniref:Uncharacterized protein n=1 Tax=Ixodes persulcatus TaxID=34615 RepID=A0AC60PD16_IXOPE|nr:hypothetical protein HPB47_005418 [Ixodes persulcatus]
MTGQRIKASAMQRQNDDSSKRSSGRGTLGQLRRGPPAGPFVTPADGLPPHSPFPLLRRGPVRWKVTGLWEAGHSQRQISSATGVGRKTVGRIIEAYRDEQRVDDAPRGTRAPATSTDLLIVAAICDDPFLTVPELKSILNLRASRSTIERRLHEAGLHCRIAAKKPRLYERHRQARLAFAQAHSSLGYEEWSQVVFTDEVSFCSRWDQQLRVWRPAYCRLVGSFDALQYTDIIDHVLLPFLLDGPYPDGLFLLQHDRSPVHQAGTVKRLPEQRAITALPWPPGGADLNIIKNVWGILKKRLSRRNLADSSMGTLESAIREEWDRLRHTQDTLLPKEKLRHKMAELLQQLEDRDQLISQLRVSNNKLSARPRPDEGAAKSFAEADALSRDAVECTTERRLTKDVQELREELMVFVEALEDETGYGDGADREDEDEMVSAERMYREQAHNENFQAREKAMQEQVVFLQAEVERLNGASLGLQQELGKALSDLSASYGREQETGERLHNVALELEEKRTCSATLHTQIATGVRALTELQSSQEQLLGQLQEAAHKEARTAGELECALAELRAVAAERTDLAKASDDLRKASDLKAEQIATLKRMAKKYVVVCRWLERENLQLRKELHNYSEKDHTEVSMLQKRLEDSCAEAQRWKNDYELLQARVAPFQEVLKLQEQNLKQMKRIQELELKSNAVLSSPLLLLIRKTCLSKIPLRELGTDPTSHAPVAAPIVCMQPSN